MFNDTVCPYVKSMNQELRKTHLEDLADFNNKTIELKASFNSFEKEGLFCLVDFIETNEVYIFKIREFTDNKITLDSFLKINKESWLSLDCKEHITKPGLMGSNSLKFISGIKNMVLPNHKKFESNKIKVKILKSRVKCKNNIITSLKNKTKSLDLNYKQALKLNKKYYENKIRVMEEEFEIKLKSIVKKNEKTEKRIETIKKDYEDKITAEKQKQNSVERQNIANGLNEFVSIIIFIVPIILHNIFIKK